MFIYHTTQANAGHMIDSALRKKKWSQNSSNFVLGNCATLEVWAIFSLLIMFGTKTIIAKNKLISREVKHCNCITVIDQLLYQSHTETSSFNIHVASGIEEIWYFMVKCYWFYCMGVDIIPQVYCIGSSDIFHLITSWEFEILLKSIAK